ncbi:response regulator transcription factor [filamentous cyanobacterium LEGE 11480]|uniref:Response regulator transcription factor n=1 Tax=Romeriopsis navalis LEGE 11480 TaxID=2777977 RepID=A0A928VLR3_9CYAN|nr:response regulator transcription factor [Romeriopsis navalis]MBE9028334.1 response regulator transcription factor [Romeriopsis navalis LEGE 11480]
MAAFELQIIETNPHLRSLLSWHLQQAGYGIFSAGDLTQAKEMFYQRQPKMLILSADLPDSLGLDFCAWLRQQQPQLLILMLSARDTEADVVAGLRSGADDYLKKPFGMQELMARVAALARRSKTVAPPAYLDYGPLKIDLVHRRVRFYGELIDLTPQEFSLLYVLAQVAGKPLSRADLLQRAWPDEIDNPRTVDTHVLSLRKKVELDPQQPSLIQTVRNVGYRLNLEGLASEANGADSESAAQPNNRIPAVAAPTEVIPSVPGS